MFLKIRFARARLRPCALPELILLGCTLAQAASVPNTAGAQPLDSLKSFSSFQDVNVAKLQAGEILGEPGSPMKFPTGISADTCFLVPAPPSVAAEHLQFWDPSLKGTLKTLEFHTVTDPCTAADFQGISLNPANRPQRWLLDKSATPLSRKSELNLTREEARYLADCVKSRPGSDAISACWATILLGRATLFQREGCEGILAYETSGQKVIPSEHLRTMLRERPAVAREFAPLLRECGVLEDKATLEPYYYWALYEANRRATLTLGAVFRLAVGDRYQLMDVQYYVSGSYYTFVTLYEVWPMEVGGKPGALVWRGDFFSAPTLAYTRGVERLAYGAFMLQELKKTTRSFLENGLKPTVHPGQKLAR